MLFESAHVRVTAEYGTATLWLAFPGEPANALDSARLRELDAAVAAVSARPAVRILVVRSALPHGFCAGLRPAALASLTHPADRAAFAWHGQQVFARLADLDAVTVAFIGGPCLGAGLELALACDHRVCVAGPTTHLGFPDRVACFGGSARLRAIVGRRADDVISSGRTLSGREGRSIGLVDVACCERRAKIELRTLLDDLERRPLKPRRAVELVGLAAERRAFAERTPNAGQETSIPPTTNPLPPFPNVVGLLGEDTAAERLVAEAVLRGGSAVVCGSGAGVFAGIEVALARGFVTPLEAEQARRRVHASGDVDGVDRAGLVFVAEGHSPQRLAAVLRPRTVVCVHSPDPYHDLRGEFSRRVLRVTFDSAGRIALFPGRHTDPDTTATVAAWLKSFGLSPAVLPAPAGVFTRAA